MDLSKLFRPVGLILFSLFKPTSQAFACPFCHTNTAEKVRLGLLETTSDFNNIVALFLPFFVFVAVYFLLRVK